MLSFLHTPYLIIANGGKPITTIPTNDSRNSFTVSYLINSCGLSQEKAITASKLVQFENPSKPDSVLNLLKNYGFTSTHISKFVTKYPPLLVYNPDKFISPKFEFFRCIGFSDAHLIEVLSADPQILSRSLEKQIKPSIGFLKSIVHTEDNVVKMLNSSMWVLKEDPKKRIIPNIEILQAYGVPEYNISQLFIARPRILLTNTDRIKQVVQEVKEMGFDPLKVTFTRGILTLVSISKTTWEMKVKAYKSWGWSEEEFHMAFIKQPSCMMISEKKIKQVMDFLVNKMGYESSLMANNPNVLLLSLEKRIIPRCLVLQILISKGLVKKDCSLMSVLVPPDKQFLKNYVTKFEEEVPELFSVYHGKVNSLGLPSKYEEVSDMNIS